MKFLPLPAQASDISGKRFGRLVAIGPIRRVVFPSGKSHFLWFCRCDCGGKAELASSRLKRSHTLSCGCLKSDVNATVARQTNTTHSESSSIEYKIWRGMMSRCTENSPVSERYYDRGIEVCERWQKFENFLVDMGRRPSPKHSIDRFPDNDGNYEPGNCRWATREQQMQNTRRTMIVTAFGKTQPLVAYMPGFSKWPPYQSAKGRIRKGWDAERVVMMAWLGR